MTSKQMPEEVPTMASPESIARYAEYLRVKVNRLQIEIEALAGQSGQPVAGFRVLDDEGTACEYPEATQVSVGSGNLYVQDADEKTLAVFRRWDYAERIA